MKTSCGGNKSLLPAKNLWLLRSTDDLTQKMDWNRAAVKYCAGTCRQPGANR